MEKSHAEIAGTTGLEFVFLCAPCVKSIRKANNKAI